MITVPAEEKKGWDRNMLKLLSASGDLDASLPRFNPSFRIFPLGHRLAPREVNMGTTEKALSFNN